MYKDKSMVVKEKKTKNWIFVMIAMLCSFQFIVVTLPAGTAVPPTNTLNDIFEATSTTLLQTTTSSDGTTTTTDTALAPQNTEDSISEQVSQVTGSPNDIPTNTEDAAVAATSSPVTISAATISAGVLSVSVNDAANNPINEAVVTVMGKDYYTNEEGGAEISVPDVNGNVLVTARNSISSTSTYVQSNTDVTANTFARRVFSRLQTMISYSWFDTIVTRLLQSIE